MPGGAGRMNRDIGENGRQPNDYAASYWDELRIINLRPAVGRSAGMRASANDRGLPPTTATPGRAANS